jgi:hydrogenase nickel incorporation protein HypB
MSKLLSANDTQAAHNRQHLDDHHVLAINLMSSPGAGKTALLEKTIEALGGTYKIAVIEGDLETENDAQRIRAKGVPAIQICTGSACHLDAHLIHEALHQLDLDDIDILFIENIGNLVCPAAFDLGQHRNVVLLSVPEGDDKPAKYPVMFRAADLVLISKTDLLEVLDDFDPEAARHHLHNLASSAPVMSVSARDTTTLTDWIDWLLEQRHSQPLQKTPPSPQQRSQPAHEPHAR